MSDQTYSTAESRLLLPSRLWGWLAMMALISVPFAQGIAVPVSSKRALNLTLFDPLIWIVSAWLVTNWLLKKKHKTFFGWVKRSWPGFVLVCVAILSFLGADFDIPQSKTLFIKGLIQWVEYLVLAPLVFAVLLEDPVWRTRALAGFFLAGTAALVSPLFYSPGFDSKSIAATIHYHGGLFGNRHSYGIFMLLWMVSVPLVFDILEKKKELWGKEFYYITMGLVMAVVIYAFGSIMSTGAFLGLVLFFAIYLFNKQSALFDTVAIVIFIFLCSSLFLDFGNGNILLEDAQVYVNYTDPGTGANSRRHTMRYYRWSANMEMFAHNPRFGVGLEQYQKRIGGYYDLDRPLPEGRTDRPATFNVETSEPFSFGWFFLTLGELGGLGGLALLILFGNLVNTSLKKFKNGDPAGMAILAVACGLLLAGWFVSPMVRGVGGSLGFVLALAWCRPTKCDAEITP